MACQDGRDEATVITSTSIVDNDKSALISNKEDKLKNEGSGGVNKSLEVGYCILASSFWGQNF